MFNLKFKDWLTGPISHLYGRPTLIFSKGFYYLFVNNSFLKIMPFSGDPTHLLILRNGALIIGSVVEKNDRYAPFKALSCMPKYRSVIYDNPIEIFKKVSNLGKITVNHAKNNK